MPNLAIILNVCQSKKKMFQQSMNLRLSFDATNRYFGKYENFIKKIVEDRK